MLKKNVKDIKSQEVKFQSCPKSQTFAETGKTVSELRDEFVKYCKKHPDPKGPSRYEMRCKYGTDYYGIDLSKYVIEANSQLEAIVIMKDHINQFARMPKTSDAYDDEDFADVIMDNEIEDNNLSDIFKHKKIRDVIDYYVMYVVFAKSEFGLQKILWTAPK